MKFGNFVNHWRVTRHADSYEAIAIHFYPDVLQLIFEDQIPQYLQQPANTNDRNFHEIDKNSILKGYIDSLLIYFDNIELFNADTIVLKLKELIALLYHLDSHGVREILSDMFNPYQIEFKKVISKHLFNDLSIDEYVTLLNLSISTFKRKFKTICGPAPGQYIQGKRLKRAAQLLSSKSFTTHHFNGIGLKKLNLPREAIDMHFFVCGNWGVRPGKA